MATRNWLTDYSETVIANGNTVLRGNVLSNMQTEAGNVVVSSFSAGGQTVTPGNSLTLNGVGVVQFQANGDYVFTPQTDYSGSVPTISYTFNNGSSQLASSLNITLNKAPISLSDGNEIVAVPDGSSVSGNVLDNAVSGNGSSKVGAYYYVNGTSVATGNSHTIENVGTITLNADGSYTMLAAQNATAGDVDVRYVVTNGEQGNNSNLALKVGADAGSVLLFDADEGLRALSKEVTGNVLDNAASSNGTLEVVGVSVNGQTHAVGTEIDLGSLGTFQLDADGVYHLNAEGSIDFGQLEVAYTVSNGVNQVASNLSLGVDLGASDFFFDDIYTSDLSDNSEIIATSNPNGVSGNVLDNVDSDLPASVLEFSVNKVIYAAGETVDIEGVGNISIAGNGQFSFVPDAGFTGAIPDVRYVVSNNVNNVQSALKITVGDTFIGGSEASGLLAGGSGAVGDVGAVGASGDYSYPITAVTEPAQNTAATGVIA